MYPDLLPLVSSSLSLGVGSVVAEEVSVSFVERVEVSASMSEVSLALGVIVELSISISVEFVSLSVEFLQFALESVLLAVE